MSHESCFLRPIILLKKKILCVPLDPYPPGLLRWLSSRVKIKIHFRWKFSIFMRTLCRSSETANLQLKYIPVVLKAVFIWQQYQNCFYNAAPEKVWKTRIPVEISSESFPRKFWEISLEFAEKISLGKFSSFQHYEIVMQTSVEVVELNIF